MRRTKKQVFSLLLALAMCIGMLPTAALAATTGKADAAFTETWAESNTNAGGTATPEAKGLRLTAGSNATTNAGTGQTGPSVFTSTAVNTALGNATGDRSVKFTVTADSTSVVFGMFLNYTDKDNGLLIATNGPTADDWYWQSYHSGASNWQGDPSDGNNFTGAAIAAGSTHTIEVIWNNTEGSEKIVLKIDDETKIDTSATGDTNTQIKAAYTRLMATDIGRLNTFGFRVGHAAEIHVSDVQYTGQAEDTALYSVGGTVVDSNDAAVEGATVTMGGKSVTSDENGAWSISDKSFANGTYPLTVTQDGYMTANDSVVINGADITGKQVTRGAAINRSIKVTVNGGVLANAAVVLEDSNYHAVSDKTFTTGTDSYTVDMGTTTGSFKVRVSAPGYETKTETVNLTADTNGEQLVEVTLAELSDTMTAITLETGALKVLDAPDTSNHSPSISYNNGVATIEANSTVREYAAVVIANHQAVNGTMEFDAKRNSGTNRWAMVVRSVDHENLINICQFQNANGWAHENWLNGAGDWSNTETTGPSFSNQETRHFKVQMSGNQVNLWIDGVPVLVNHTVNTAYTNKGYWGFGHDNDTSVSIDVSNLYFKRDDTQSAVTIGAVTSGTVTAKLEGAESDLTSGANVYAGDTVVVTATPSENHQIKSVKYNDGTDHVLEAVEGVYSFVMPSAAVTVSAEFEELIYHVPLYGKLVVETTEAGTIATNLADNQYVKATAESNTLTLLGIKATDAAQTINGSSWKFEVTGGAVQDVSVYEGRDAYVPYATVDYTSDTSNTNVTAEAVTEGGPFTVSQTVTGGAKGKMAVSESDQYNFTGTAVSLADALYTFKPTGAANTFKVYNKQGETLYHLNFKEGSNVVPNRTGDENDVDVVFTAGGSANTFYLRTPNASDGAGLYFHATSEPHFNRNGSSAGTDFLLYRPAKASETASTDIPGYVRVTELSDITEGVYLIVAHSTNTTHGGYYVLYPGGSSGWQQALKVDDAQTTDSEAITWTATQALKLTGVAATAENTPVLVIAGGNGYNVTVSPLPTHNVTWTLSNVTSTNKDTTVTEGSDLTATLSAAEHYTLPETITVTVGGTELTAGENTYTYEKSTGALTVKAAAITGDVVITATATQNATPAPAFEENGDSYTFTNSTDKAATFTLSGTPAATYKVYASNEATQEAEGVTASVSGTTLTLTFDAQPNAATTYYISATATGCAESTRTAVTVTPFAAKASAATFQAMSQAVYEQGYPENVWTNKPKQVSAFGVPSFSDVNATGTLNYITGFTGFNPTKPEEQEGTYLALMVEVPADATNAATVTIRNGESGTADKTATAENFDTVTVDSVEKTYFSIIHGISSTSTPTYIIDWDGTGDAYTATTYTLNVSGMKFQGIETKPAATIDYAGEKLQNLTANAQYTVTIKSDETTLPSSDVTADADGKIALDADWFNKTVTIVKKGADSDPGTVDSKPQELTIPARPATPELTGVAPTTHDGTGKITGLTADTAYEISSDNGTTWQDATVTGTEITNLTANKTYQVRVKAGASSFASAAADVTIGEFEPTTLTGSVAIEGTAKFGEQLTATVTGAPNGVALKYQWKRTKDSTTANIGEATTTNTYTLVEADIGATITVEVSTEDLNYTGTLTSAATDAVAKADGPAAPTNLGSTGCVAGATPSTGTITGVDNTMEYSVKDANSWKAITTTTVEGLAAGTYEVRVAETTTTKAGTAAEVVVKVKAAAPTGLGFTKPTNAGDSDATITGVNDTMEYSAKGADTWTSVTSSATTITGLAAGAYEVRVKEAGNVEASDSVLVTIPDADEHAINLPHDLEGGSVTASVSSSEVHSAAENATVTLTVTPADGYQLKAGTKPTVTGASGNVTVNGSGDTYTFTMPGEDVTVTAEFEKKTYTVTYALTHMAAVANGSATHGVAFTSAALTADAGYVLPAAVTVAVGGTNLTDADYTYNASTGVVTINADKVIGNVTITATATAATVTDAATAVVPANLADTATPAIDPLYKTYTATAAKTASGQANEFDVTVTATELRAHTNDNGDASTKAYWVGIGMLKPDASATYNYYFEQGDGTTEGDGTKVPGASTRTQQKDGKTYNTLYLELDTDVPCTITAKLGDETVAIYHVKSVGGTIVDDAMLADKTTLESKTWTGDNTVTDAETAKTKAEALVGAVALTSGATATVNAGTYEAPVNGTKEAPNGTDGSYTFTITLADNSTTLPDGVAKTTVTTTEQTMTIPAAAYTTKNIKSIAQPNTVTVAYGTAKEDLTLPATVTATLADDSTVEIPVTWACETYSATTPDTYTFTGTLTLPANVTNDDDVAVSIQVTVQTQVVETKNIKSIAQPTAVTVAYGTAKEDLTLPATVTATLADDSTVEIPVTWACETYSATTPDTYTFTGTLTLPANVTNDDDVAVSIQVTVNAGTTPAPTPGGNLRPVKPSEPTTPEPTVTENPDGSTTTTVTAPDGTKTVTTEMTDGTTEVVETKPDGTITETVTKTDENGDKTVTETVTTPEGAVTTTVTEADGTEIKTEAAPEKDTTVTVTLPEGKTEASVTVPAGIDYTTVAVDENGNIVNLSVPTEHLDAMQVKVEGNATLTLVQKPNGFVDIGGHWAENEIDFAAAHEFVNGTTPTTFSPNAEMTRGMMVTILARVDGADTTATTGATWYDAGKNWAVSEGISDGTHMEDLITREQLATMLWRYAGCPEASGELNFTDAGSVSGYAATAMRWAVENGIFQGMGDGTLAPRANATRAQAAAVILRFCALLVK